MDLGLSGPETKNDCAGEGQQQFTRPTEFMMPAFLQMFRSICREYADRILHALVACSVNSVGK
jgi:hypothetical protein